MIASSTAQSDINLISITVPAKKAQFSNQTPDSRLQANFFLVAVKRSMYWGRANTSLVSRQTDKADRHRDFNTDRRICLLPLQVTDTH